MAAVGVVWAGSFAVGFVIAPTAEQPHVVFVEAEQPQAIERILDADAPSPLRIRTCVPDFSGLKQFQGDLAASVSTAEGEALWQSNADLAVAPASVLKLFTVVSAWRVLGPDHRLVTRVVAGTQPGEVWLIGGGDATLTRSPENWGLSFECRSPEMPGGWLPVQRLMPLMLTSQQCVPIRFTGTQSLFLRRRGLIGNGLRANASLPLPAEPNKPISQE